MDANLGIWNRLCTTPKDAQTPYDRNGTSLTAIDPTYRNKALTEIFGMAGAGWGFTLDEHWSEQFHGTHYCYAAVTLWIYIEGRGGQKVATYIGGTKVVQGEADEAYKSAITDALTKCTSVLGFGADVYAGKSDKKPDSLPKGTFEVAKQCLTGAIREKNDKAFKEYTDRVLKSPELTEEEKAELLAFAAKQKAAQPRTERNNATD